MTDLIQMGELAKAAKYKLQNLTSVQKNHALIAVLLRIPAMASQ